MVSAAGLKWQIMNKGDNPLLQHRNFQKRDIVVSTKDVIRKRTMKYIYYHRRYIHEDIEGLAVTSRRKKDSSGWASVVIMKYNVFYKSDSENTKIFNYI